MIEISENGTHAWGQWNIFGPHTNRVFAPETKTKKDTAFWIAGKYDNEFVKENGEWKILKLRPICWLRTPYHKDFLECPGCWTPGSPSLPICPRILFRHSGRIGPAGRNGYFPRQAGPFHAKIIGACWCWGPGCD